MGKSSMDIAVRLVGKAGTPDADNPLCAPVILCKIATESGVWHRSVIGMLDSGAYPYAMDTGLWQAIGLPIVGSDTLHSVTQVAVTPICEATILVENATDEHIAIPARFAVIPIRAQGQPYDLVLGRQFLTQFDFGYSLQRGWYLSHPAAE